MHPACQQAGDEWEDRGVTIEDLRRILGEYRERVQSIGRHL
jgi:hypothetical protein